MKEKENNKKEQKKAEALDNLKKVHQKTIENTRKTVEAYKSFAIKGNIIDMAIGVAIGSAFTNIVNTLVSSTITPFISVFTNNVDLSKLFVSLSGGHFGTIEEAKAAGAITLNYGMLLNSILNFIIISIVLFIVVVFIKTINKKDAKKQEAVNKITTKKCPYCCSTIAIEASRCAFCTSELEQVKNVKKK